MAEQDNKITNVKIEIRGEWYATSRLGSYDCGCNACELKDYCEAFNELYKFCTHLDWNIYFKKVTGKSLEEARFFHG